MTRWVRFFVRDRPFFEGAPWVGGVTQKNLRAGVGFGPQLRRLRASLPSQEPPQKADGAKNRTHRVIELPHYIRSKKSKNPGFRVTRI